MLDAHALCCHQQLSLLFSCRLSGQRSLACCGSRAETAAVIPLVRLTAATPRPGEIICPSSKYACQLALFCSPIWKCNVHELNFRGNLCKLHRVDGRAASLNTIAYILRKTAAVTYQLEPLLLGLMALVPCFRHGYPNAADMQGTTCSISADLRPRGACCCWVCS